jgi:hypothetical protein
VALSAQIPTVASDKTSEFGIYQFLGQLLKYSKTSMITFSYRLLDEEPTTVRQPQSGCSELKGLNVNSFYNLVGSVETL